MPSRLGSNGVSSIWPFVTSRIFKSYFRPFRSLQVSPSMRRGEYPAASIFYIRRRLARIRSSAAEGTDEHDSPVFSDRASTRSDEIGVGPSTPNRSCCGVISYFRLVDATLRHRDRCCRGLDSPRGMGEPSRRNPAGRLRRHLGDDRSRCLVD